MAEILPPKITYMEVFNKLVSIQAETNGEDFGWRVRTHLDPALAERIEDIERTIRYALTLCQDIQSTGVKIIHYDLVTGGAIVRGEHAGTFVKKNPWATQETPEDSANVVNFNRKEP